MSTQQEQQFVHCGKCGHEWSIGFLPMPIATFVKVGKRPCIACGKRPVLMGIKPKDTAEGDPIAWLTNGDTGTSSMTIWCAMMKRPFGQDHGWPDVPYDPDDFGRCYRLLKIMPSWRGRLGEVAEKYPRWRGLVEHWDELTALYEEELPSRYAPKLYARITELIERKPVSRPASAGGK